jgi:hypothetical protein
MDNRAANAPALRSARVKDASVGACIYERKWITTKPKNPNTFQKKKRKEKKNTERRCKKNRTLTSGHSTVRAFMFIT